VSITVLIQLQARPETSDALKAYLDQILPGTRAAEGCLDLHLGVDQDDPTRVVSYETWASRAQFETYFAWPRTPASSNNSAHCSPTNPRSDSSIPPDRPGEEPPAESNRRPR
jgi:quinol monooxygenase YgiN